MRALLSILFSLILLPAFPQVSTVYVSGQNMSDYFRMYASGNEDEEAKVYGSPYADDHWTVGTISFKETNSVVSDHLRLNAYSNELEIFNKGKKMAIIQPFKLKEARVGNRKYIYSFYLYYNGKNEYLSSSYFEVICEGRIELLRRYYVAIVNNSYVSNYMGGGGDGRNHYTLKNEIFYRSGDNEAARKLPAKKKEILELMKDRENEIALFIKENKINFRTDFDLEKTLNYYNSL
ncbi:MAG: hypothetical protein V2I37_04040 [Marinilabiliaceae bacterium]|jgi:hypothetical protein|nr:hypothetical protein [Marinilabiliaceae bacterium]